MDARRRWTRDELLLALHLYERIPFGQQDQSNAQVIELAGVLSRTPGSVAMKLNNLTSLDPEEKARGVRGLVGASELDRKVWNEFQSSADATEESEQLWEVRVERMAEEVEPPKFLGVTEALAARKIRLGQKYFRRVVLANFGHRCALTGISQPDLLNASHISAWSLDAQNRVDVRNGLCLNKLHDAAFDRKLITFDPELRLVVGKRLRKTLPAEPLASGFLAYEGRPLAVPVRREVSRALLDEHRAAFKERD